jgi:hypothetical protein
MARVVTLGGRMEALLKTTFCSGYRPVRMVLIEGTVNEAGAYIFSKTWLSDANRSKLGVSPRLLP